MKKEEKDRVRKRIEAKKSAVVLLTPLVGKTPKQMSKAEQEALLTALGQLLNVLDKDERVVL